MCGTGKPKTLGGRERLESLGGTGLGLRKHPETVISKEKFNEVVPEAVHVGPRAPGGRQAGTWLPLSGAEAAAPGVGRGPTRPGNREQPPTRPGGPEEILLRDKK